MIEVNLTSQEIFDKVAAHLLEQKFRCMDRDGISCLYVNAQGMKCAAGCLIPDEDYTLELEKNNWRELVEAGYVSSDNMMLVSSLQGIHDRHEATSWRDKLQSLAESHKLKFKF